MSNLNSNQPDFDWYERGLWIAVHPEDGPDPQFVATTPHSCRVALLRALGRSASNSEAWTIQKLVEATEPTLTLQDVAVSDESHWRYPAAGALAPRGIEVQLLTKGGIQVRGVWEDGGAFIAWAPMIKRDKELERKYGL